MENNALPKRFVTPLDVLRNIGKQSPDLWKYLDAYRYILISKENTKQYPESFFDKGRCFLPDAGYRRLADKVFPPGTPVEDQVRTMDVIAAVAAWRPSMDVINIDDDVLMALLDTPCEKVPAEILGRLPSWSIYVTIPMGDYFTLGGAPIAGFFAYYGDPIYWPATSQGTELHILPWTSEGAICESVALNLEAETVADALLESMRHKLSPEQFATHMAQPEMPEAHAEMSKLTGRFISVLLYIITQHEERLKNNPKEDKLCIPSPKRTKNGWRLFQPNKPKLWNLGQEIGEQIREGKKQVRQHSGTHEGPRPHIRRAHWHTYWTGRRVWKEGETPVPQTAEAKWLPPIPVALAEDELPEL